MEPQKVETSSEAAKQRSSGCASCGNSCPLFFNRRCDQRSSCLTSGLQEYKANSWSSQSTPNTTHKKSQTGSLLVCTVTIWLYHIFPLDSTFQQVRSFPKIQTPRLPRSAGQREAWHWTCRSRSVGFDARANLLLRGQVTHRPGWLGWKPR